MKYLIILLFGLLSISAKAQFPGGTDTLRRFNTRFITNDAKAAFTNLRLHNLIAGILDEIDSTATGGNVNLGMDTLWSQNDSTLIYRKNGLFYQVIVRGSTGAGPIYRVPFSDGVHLTNDSNFKFDKSQGANAARLIVGPTTITSGGLAKINATSDNMNALALTAYGTGLNTVIFQRARGTIAAPTKLLSGDDLFNLSMRGYDGATWVTSGKAAIYGQAAQDWGVDTNGTKLFFRTTPNNSGTAADRLVIDQNGHVGINNTSPTYGLTVNRSMAVLKDSIPQEPSITSQSVLIIDTITGQYKRASTSVITSNITASNGLTKTGNNIALGGTVTSNTALSIAGTSSSLLNISSTSSSAFAPLIISDNGTGQAFVALQSNNTGKGIVSQHSGTGTSIQALSSGGVALDASDNGGGIGVSAYSETGIPMRATSNTNNNNATSTVLNLVRNNGTAATGGGVGMGANLLFTLEDGSGAGGTLTAGRFTSRWTGVTNGSENSALDFYTMGSGTSDVKLTIGANGLHTFSKYTSGGSFLQTDTTNYKPLAVDASGNMYRMTGWPGSGGGSTPNLESVLTAGATLTNTHTWDAGTNTQTLSGSQSSSANSAWVFSNTGNGNAISASSTGTGGTILSLNSSSGTGIQGQSSSGIGVVGVSTSGTAFRGQNNPSSTNAVENIMTLSRTSSSGAGANGIGAAIQTELETATNGNSQIAGLTAFKWTDATSATRTSQFEVSTVNSASTAVNLTVSGAGRLGLPAYASSHSNTDNTLSNLVVDGSGDVYKYPKVAFYQTATGSVVATNVEGTLVSSGTGSTTIPANTMTAGKSYELIVRGKYSTDATNPANMNWKLYLGSTVITSSGVTGLGTNKTDKNYEIHITVTCRTTGASGTVMAQGMFFTEDGPGANGIDNGFATATIDTTVNETMDFKVVFNDGSAGNSCYAYILIFREI